MTPDNPPIPACDSHRPLFDATMERHDRALERLAKQVCNGCPLLDTCRATYTREEYRDVAGIVAGMTHAERFPDRNPTVNRRICGTPHGSRTHYKRGENPCEPCRLAQNAAKRARGTTPPKDFADAARERWEDHHDQRLADLQHLLDAGSGMGAVLRQLGLSREALRRWCQRNGHADLWAILVGEGGAGVHTGRVATPRRMEGAA